MNRLTVQCAWLHKQPAQRKQHHRAELHLPFSLTPAGQALAVEHTVFAGAVLTTLSKYPLQAQLNGHLAK